MSILAGLSTFWGAVCSPSAQAIIGLANLGGTTYTAVKASQNSNKLSSLQSSVYGIARDLKEVKAQTSDLFTISDLEAMVGGTTPTTTAPTAAATTTTTAAPAAAPTQAAAVPPVAPASPAQDNNVPAWAQQLIQQQLQQAEVIKGLMQQNTASAVPANTTVNVNPTPTAPAVPTAPPATATDSAPVTPSVSTPGTAPASAAVDPGVMAFLQQQAEAMNKLASAVTALETSIGALEAATDDAHPTTTTTTTTPPTPPVGGWNDEDEDIEDLIEKSDSHYPASSKKRRKKKKHKKK